MEARAQALAASGRTASAGGMFRYLGSMVYNGQEMLRAREIQRENKENARQAKVNSGLQELQTLFEEASAVYQDYSTHHDHDLDKLKNKQLEKLVKYIVKKEAKPKDAFSHHSANAAKLKKRLGDCKQQWENYFIPVEQEGGENDENVDMEVVA